MKHIPVLLNESIEGLNIKPSGVYVDLTLGRAGHSSEIAKRLKTGKLICFDKDVNAINECKDFLDSNKNKVIAIHDDFRNFKNRLLELGINKVDGILADLGVSSPQFDDISRGFSYKESARLDMRMDQRQEIDAQYIVNKYSLEDLNRIFRDYGEEKDSYRIAQNIIKFRENKVIETTEELVSIIKSSKSNKELMKKGHPAKQVFQALRIEVNDELGALKQVLSDSLEMLAVNGRAAFITFHSLEDRIVKNVFNEVSTVIGSRHNVFALPSEDDKPAFKLVNRKVILPNQEELNMNNRSKSAKLRIIEKVK